MSKKPLVLLLESIIEEAIDRLEEQCDVLLPEEHDEMTAYSVVDAIITRGKGQVTPELISACPKLKVIARCGVGLDNINVDFASSQKIPVLNLPGSNAHTVAEHTMALMLNLQRNLVPVFSAVKQGDWQIRTSYQGDELRGKRLGILGLGNIGTKVAQMAEVFGCKIGYHSNNPVPGSPYEYYSLEELLSASDIITLHLPLTPKTQNLIDEASFAQMKPGAILVNTSRGALIDENALLNALESGQIGGYASDVLTVEPPADNHPLLQLPQVLITPHMASLTATTYRQMCLDTVHNVTQLLSGSVIDQKFIYNIESI